jgi:hypothetical protein
MFDPSRFVQRTLRRLPVRRDAKGEKRESPFIERRSNAILFSLRVSFLSDSLKARDDRRIWGLPRIEKIIGAQQILRRRRNGVRIGRLSKISSQTVIANLSHGVANSTVRIHNQIAGPSHHGLAARSRCRNHGRLTVFREDARTIRAVVVTRATQKKIIGDGRDHRRSNGINAGPEDLVQRRGEEISRHDSIDRGRGHVLRRSCRSRTKLHGLRRAGHANASCDHGRTEGSPILKWQESIFHTLLAKSTVAPVTSPFAFTPTRDWLFDIIGGIRRSAQSVEVACPRRRFTLAPPTIVGALTPQFP